MRPNWVARPRQDNLVALQGDCKGAVQRRTRRERLKTSRTSMRLVLLAFFCNATCPLGRLAACCSPTPSPATTSPQRTYTERLA